MSTDTTEFALWAVWSRAITSPDDRIADLLDEVEVGAREAGITVRGIYDVSGLRADADLMIWTHGPAADALQSVFRDHRRVLETVGLVPVWNAMGVHRDAEFSRSHAPAFMRGLGTKEWATVYPFVRSYEWYLLPEEDRREMLGDHGRKGSEYPSVQANTVASFALGDYEWILALEADDVVDLVDLMRHLRGTEARRHVREEVPFYTGRLITSGEVAEVVR